MSDPEHTHDADTDIKSIPDEGAKTEADGGTDTDVSAAAADSSTEASQSADTSSTRTYADNAEQQASSPSKSETIQPPTGASSEQVGHVVVFRDLVVTHEGDDSSITAYVNRESRPDVRTGSYVQIPYPLDPNGDPDCNDELFAMVEAVRYLNEGEINELTQTMNAVRVDGESNERRYDQVVHLKPLAIIRKDRNEEGEVIPIDRKNVDTVPKPFTWMYHSNEEEYLRKGLNIPETGLSIGHLAKNGDRVPAENPLIYNILNPGAGESGEARVFRHGMVAGTSGKGKSFFTKNVLRQMMDGTEYEMESVDGQYLNPQLPAFVIIDPENEYSELREDSEAEQSVLDDLKRQGIQVNGIDSDPRFDLETFVPKAMGAQSPTNLTSHQEFSIPFHRVRSNPELLISFKAEGPTQHAIRKVIDEYFQDRSRSSTPTSYQNFADYLDRHDQMDFDQNMLAQANNISSGMWGAVMRRLKNRTFSRVFDSGADSMTEIANKLVKPGRVSVIPTGHLDPYSEKLVVMNIMNFLVENKIGSGNRKKQIYETPLVLCVDEAHNYLSNSENIQDQYIVSKFRRIAKQGRKYKMGMFLVSQNPEDIDEDIRKQVNTKIYLGLEPEVLKKIDVPDGFGHMIPDFGKGQAVVKAPDVRAAEIRGFDVCLTKHSK